MPGFLAHYIAGQAVLNSLHPAINKKIKSHEKLYNLGTQGPDIFFYYIPGFLRKQVRGIAPQMHKSNLGNFLMETATAAKDTPPPERDIVFAYAAGFIMHYVLDANAHPYVYACTENSTYPKIKNSSNHLKFETAIDILMLKLTESKKPAEIKQWQLICADKAEMKVAANIITSSLNKTYARSMKAKNVYKAMRHMCVFTRLMQSAKGRRKKIVGTMETLTIRHPLVSSLIHEQLVSDGKDYLNEKHKPWHPPWDENTCTDSFLDRFETATKEGFEMIEILHDYIYNNQPKEKLMLALGNRSLKTGLDT